MIVMSLRHTRLAWCGMVLQGLCIAAFGALFKYQVLHVLLQLMVF